MGSEWRETVLREMMRKGGFVKLGSSLIQGKLPQVYEDGPS